MVALISSIMLFSIGCREVKQEFSNILHEDATISDAVYTPSRHDSELGLTAFKTGPIGVDFGGNLGFRIGSGLQISSVEVPEKFAIVFKCQHGQFIIGRKEVYEKLKDHKDKRVDVSYREIYRTVYDTEGGEKKIIERALTDYDFINATLKPD